MGCPLSREPVRPGEPVALVKAPDRTCVIHLVRAAPPLLALDDAVRTAALLVARRHRPTDPGRRSPPALRGSACVAPTPPGEGSGGLTRSCRTTHLRA